MNLKNIVNFQNIKNLKKIKFTKKNITISVVVLILIFIGIYQVINKNENQEYSFVKVKRGEISQKVLETGTIRSTRDINLSFQGTGILENILVSTGQTIQVGQSLARLNNNLLKIQLTEANSALQAAQAKFRQLSIGASSEEINLAKKTVEEAETALRGANDNLKNTQTKSQNSLNQSYESAFVYLETAFLQVENSFNFIEAIQRRYFFGADEESSNTRKQRDMMQDAFYRSQSSIRTASLNSPESINTSLKIIRSALVTANESLRMIRGFSDNDFYRNLVSATDKALLETQSASVNLVLTNVVNHQQNIISVKSSNENSINLAQNRVDNSNLQLQKAQESLNLIIAQPQQANIDFHLAQINQAQARVNFLQEQIKNTTLTSPINGLVSRINKTSGEVVQPFEPIITIISTNNWQVEVNIYEEDIVNIKTGNVVDISIIAFPDTVFRGKVSEIKPMEKLIGGVVHYEVIINFTTDVPINIKSGMTADISIHTIFKNNVLIIPDKAIQEENGKFNVLVYQNGLIENRIIQIGLRGDNDFVEILAGLNENEKIILQ